MPRRARATCLAGLEGGTVGREEFSITQPAARSPRFFDEGPSTGRPRFSRRGFLVAGALTPLIAGCTRQPAPRPVLHVFLGLDAYERTLFERELLPAFARRTGTEVWLAGGTPAEMRERIAAPPLGEERPDLAALDLEMLGDLAPAGAVASLEDYRVHLPPTAPAAVVGALAWNGALVALPWRPAVWLNYYDRASFSAAGIAPPETWAALPRAANALRSTSATTGIALQGAAGGPAAQTLLELVWSFGGDPLRLDDAGSLTACRYVASIAPLLSSVTATAKIDSMSTALSTGRIAWGPNWSVAARDLLQKAGEPELTAYVGPAGPGGATHLISGQVLVIPRHATKRELALQFVDYLWSPSTQRWLAARLAWPPLLPEAFDALPAWQQPIAGALASAFASARFLPPLPDRAALESILSDVFRAIAFEHHPVDGVLQDGAARLQRLRLP